MVKKRIIVTCALIVKGEEVLAAQRSSGMRHPLKWEFPGGKAEEGENPETCIVREIAEELGIRVRATEAMLPVQHDYPDMDLELLPFICHWESGVIVLREHRQVQWLKPHELEAQDWVDADIAIVKQWLRRTKGE